MRKNNQTGAVNALAIPLTLMAILALGLAIFGGWAFLQYTDQRDNVDEIVAEAVSEAETAKTTQLQAEFDELSKSPVSNYVSQSQLGSISVSYPRTWSAYVDETENNSKPLDAFFHPSYVPADSDTAYALRVSVEARDYDDQLASFDRELESGALTAEPIKKVGVVGTLLEGEIDRDLSGAMVLFPLRDKTLKVWTEADKFVKDFKDIVLENLSFVP